MGESAGNIQDTMDKRVVNHFLHLSIYRHTIEKGL